MKKLFLVLALAVAPISSYAQTVDTAQPAVATPAAAPEPAATEDPAPTATENAPLPDSTPGELLKQTGKVVSDWRALGWFAGLIALINLLINLLRLPMLDTLLKKYKKKWLKPYIAAGLGALLGSFTSYATDANVLNAIMLGLMAGMGAVGIHEAASKRKAENRGA